MILLNLLFVQFITNYPNTLCTLQVTESLSDACINKWCVINAVRWSLQLTYGCYAFERREFI